MSCLPIMLLMAAGQTPSFSLLLLGAVLMLTVFVVILVMLSRSLNRLRHGAESFAKGDLSQPLEIQSPLQIADVAESLNRMAQQLQDRLGTLAQQRNELDAVLVSMAEGVLAIDSDERVIRMNPAAAAMLGIDPAAVLGRSIQEAVRNTALQQFVAQTLRGQQAMQDEIVLQPVDSDAGPTNPAIAAPRSDLDRARRFQVYGATLHDAAGQRIGALIVLHDVTRLTRLERVRQDFVANVSHEIMTPVTAIKAAVETILDQEPLGEAEPFLRMIARQAERLQAITEDLLSLARIEQDNQQHRMETAPTSISRVLRGAVETCEAQSTARQIEVTITCDEHIQTLANASLLEQAVVNLLDNAIKYSPVASAVRLDAREQNGELIICMTDQGVGVASEHLPRLFERFYRTDRARSRALGGTGLGLAIVKHIAQAHGGRVSVDSTLNRGSTFRIHLPMRQPVA